MGFRDYLSVPRLFDRIRTNLLRRTGVITRQHGNVVLCYPFGDKRHAVLCSEATTYQYRYGFVDSDLPFNDEVSVWRFDYDALEKGDEKREESEKGRSSKVFGLFQLDAEIGIYVDANLLTAIVSEMKGLVTIELLPALDGQPAPWGGLRISSEEGVSAIIAPMGRTEEKLSDPAPVATSGWNKEMKAQELAQEEEEDLDVE